MSFELTNTGYCHCCRITTSFYSKNSWLRDYYYCSNCHSVPRQRHIQYILDSNFLNWENLSIHESSPSNNLISRYCTNYSSSQFLENIPYGEIENGVKCENLEDLTFSDNSFDLFITQDVFEHLNDPIKASSEIIRVLKPGGSHIFTVPKYSNISVSYPRIELDNGTIKHIHEPMYHGNPVGDGRSLVTWDYGLDFESLVHDWTNYDTQTFITKNWDLGIQGEFLEVFVTTKKN